MFFFKKRHHNLPPNVYMQSYLEKAGIRFNPNVVDTICNRGLSATFFSILGLLLALLALKLTGNEELFPGRKSFYLLMAICLCYVVWYLLRLQYFRLIRRNLRRDRTPIVVEAYAIVLMDKSHGGTVAKPRRSTILFKETGSNRPRFFTAAIRNGIRQHYYQDQLGRVFIDRKNPSIYTVDSDSALQTVSEKQRKKFSIAELKTTVVDDCKKTRID